MQAETGRHRRGLISGSDLLDRCTASAGRTADLDRYRPWLGWTTTFLPSTFGGALWQ